MDRKTGNEIETENGTGAGVEVETGLEMGAMIEGLDIVAGTRDHDDLNLYYTVLHLIHFILLNRLYF